MLAELDKQSAAGEPSASELAAENAKLRRELAAMTEQRDPYGRPLYWVGPPGAADDGGEGTDFHAVQAGYASVTPMQVDLTRHDGVFPLSQWLSDI